MEAKEALEYIKEILKERTRGLISLSPIESKVFVQIWDGKTYNEMPAFIFKANGKPYSYEYLKEIGTELIDKIRNRLNIQDINKTEFKEEIEIFLNRNVNNQPIQTPNVNLTDTGNYNTPTQTPNVNFTNTDNQNPFVPTTGRIENLEKFFGREQEIKQIFELLNSASSVAIIGEKAIGKSSLLYAVYQQSINLLKFPRQNVFLDMNNIHNQEDFYFAICEKIDIPDSSGYRFTRNLENKRVLLILDNVDTFNGEGFTRDLRDHLRGLAEGENASLKLVVAANESLKTLFNDSYETSPLADICQQIDIPRWHEQIIRNFITKRLQPTSINFTEADIQQLMQASGGHPQKLTQLCYKLYKKYSESNTGLIIDIDQNRQQQLLVLEIAGTVPEIVIPKPKPKPVNNPYVIGDPVIGNLFISREDIIRQLEEFWLRGIQLQSVVIYGHRRMGKTSILLNAANSLDNQVKVVYVNLLKLGDVTQGVGEVLMAISDEISQVVNVEPPHDDDLLKLPERTFNRYFEKVIKNLSGRLIIAIDEFEKIEDLIKAGKISPDFMGFLRSLVQAHSQVAFAFAGLHTLDEMTADYFQPFFASVLPIHVGFLSRGATGQILANPAIEDFLLDYTPEALDKIYDLTYGQPYLVQLVGFHLVRLYNDFVFEQGKPRESVFTVEDVEAIVKKPEFFQRGSNYFNGVWGQAGENNDNTQQVILSHLAKHTPGLNINELIELTGIDETDLQNGLEVLKRHDVIVENQGRWRIIVELFQRWVFNMFC